MEGLHKIVDFLSINGYTQYVGFEPLLNKL